MLFGYEVGTEFYWLFCLACAGFVLGSCRIGAGVRRVVAWICLVAASFCLGLSWYVQHFTGFVQFFAGFVLSLGWARAGFVLGPCYFCAWLYKVLPAF